TRFSRDWSSDVCSSDLHQQLAESEAAREELLRGGAQDSSGLQARTLRLSQENQRLKLQLKQSQIQAEPPLLDERQQWFVIGAGRSEERRVGKEPRDRLV